MRLVANRKLGSATMPPQRVLRRVVRIAPQRIVVADAVRVVADVVARRLVAPRLERVRRSRTPMRRRSASSAFVGDLREQLRSDRRSCRAPALSRSRSALRLTLPAGVLGSSATNATMARIFVLAEPRAHEILDARWRRPSSPRPVGHDERLHHLAAQRVGHADRRGLAHVGMLQQRVLDLDRAHRPAGGDDHVVGAAGVEEVAVRVDAAEVLGRRTMRRGATP